MISVLLWIALIQSHGFDLTRESCVVGDVAIVGNDVYSCLTTNWHNADYCFADRRYGLICVHLPALPIPGGLK